MKLVCPACGATGSLEMFLRDVSARAALASALKLPPPLAPLLANYLGLFRPGKRSLTWDRVERLLSELLEPIQAGKLKRNGRDWPVPVTTWQAALEELLAKREKLNLPLKSHGYLFEIVAGMSDKAEASLERDKEEQLRNRPQLGPRQEAPERIDPHKAWERDMQRLGRSDLVERVNNTRGEDRD
jgi:hypothetical protein